MALTRQDAVPVSFVRGTPPQDPKKLVLYLMSEIERLETSMATLVQICPQVADTPPVPSLNGMIRWAKSPWNPLGTGDALVKYTGGAWNLV